MTPNEPNEVEQDEQPDEPDDVEREAAPEPTDEPGDDHTAEE